MKKHYNYYLIFIILMMNLIYHTLVKTYIIFLYENHPTKHLVIYLFKLAIVFYTCLISL